MLSPNKILFTAFDAGGGNAVLPLVRNVYKSKKFKAICIIGGLSKDIFSRCGMKFIDSDLFSGKKLKKLVENFEPDFFISGSSGGLTFDKNILPIAKKGGAKSIYVLDYWSHYSERFSDQEKDFKYLPDIICVMDKRAKQEMVEEGFDPRKIEITGNPHFDSFTKNIKSEKEEKDLILFVSQLLSGREKEFGFNEFEVLNDLLKILNEMKINYKLVIRPHPVEEDGKYKNYLNDNILIDNNSPIEKLISKAGLIIGMNSMVLFQAALASKKVISYQPNLKKKDSLISNNLGLSKLVTKKKDLKNLLKNYFNGTFPVSNKKVKNLIIPNATRNVLNLIK